MYTLDSAASSQIDTKTQTILEQTSVIQNIDIPGLEDQIILQQANCIEYWKQQLADVSPLLELPTDRPRSPVQTNERAKQYFLLAQSLSASLDIVSQQEGVTLFMTLLAAFGTLLYRSL